jgi:hypothetical protein
MAQRRQGEALAIEGGGDLMPAGSTRRTWSDLINFDQLRMEVLHAREYL